MPIILFIYFLDNAHYVIETYVTNSLRNKKYCSEINTKLRIKLVLLSYKYVLFKKKITNMLTL